MFGVCFAFVRSISCGIGNWCYVIIKSRIPNVVGEIGSHFFWYEGFHLKSTEPFVTTTTYQVAQMCYAELCLHSCWLDLQLPFYVY